MITEATDANGDIVRVGDVVKLSKSGLLKRPLVGMFENCASKYCDVVVVSIYEEDDEMYVFDVAPAREITGYGDMVVTGSGWQADRFLKSEPRPKLSPEQEALYTMGYRNYRDPRHEEF
jgi:hypothetical protein